jgi:hypothetical protein
VRGGEGWRNWGGGAKGGRMTKGCVWRGRAEAHVEGRRCGRREGVEGRPPGYGLVGEKVPCSGSLYPCLSCGGDGWCQRSHCGSCVQR